MTTININVARLRDEVQAKYTGVAITPKLGFHFHTGRPLARMLAYPAELVANLPDAVVESFAGVGNPFLMGALPEGATVLDVGSGSGFDALIAARMVGLHGRVIGVDMTPAMLEKARGNAQLLGLINVEFRKGFAEELPVPDNSVDVVISNGVINLCPDKLRVYQEIYRVLKPGGRIQIADVVVQKPVPEDAKEDIDLWTG
jgi:SAM-dependent methyltransferase